MKLWIALLIGLVGGAAWATDFGQSDNVRTLVQDYKSLKQMQGLTAADIEMVQCVAQVKEGTPGAGTTAQVNATPEDAAWTALLQALNQIVNGKVTAAKAKLEALGVTNVP